jgi:hypothetical protein
MCTDGKPCNNTDTDVLLESGKQLFTRARQAHGSDSMFALSAALAIAVVHFSKPDSESLNAVVEATCEAFRALALDVPEARKLFYLDQEMRAEFGDDAKLAEIEAAIKAEAADLPPGVYVLDLDAPRGQRVTPAKDVQDNARAERDAEAERDADAREG